MRNACTAFYSKFPVIKQFFIFVLYRFVFCIHRFTTSKFVLVLQPFSYQLIITLLISSLIDVLGTCNWFARQRSCKYGCLLVCAFSAIQRKTLLQKEDMFSWFVLLQLLFNLHAICRDVLYTRASETGVIKTVWKHKV